MQPCFIVCAPLVNSIQQLFERLQWKFVASRADCRDLEQVVPAIAVRTVLRDVRIGTGAAVGHADLRMIERRPARSGRVHHSMPREKLAAHRPRRWSDRES